MSALNAVWIAVFMWGYYFFFTLYMIPHNALIPELIQDGPARVNAYTVSSFFFVTGSALGYVSPLIVSLFKNAGLTTLSAWRTTFGIYTGIGIVLLLIPAYTIREKDYVRSILPNITLAQSLRHAFSNRHFRIVTLGQLLENTGMAFFQACIMYYVTSLMGLAETYSVLILAISIAGSLLLYPMVNKFAKKRGKKLPILLGCIVFAAAEIVICFSDVLPGNRLVLACVFALFVSFPFAVLNVLPGAMMADIIQYDTVTTGVNQEGIFGAARSFIVKMGNSLAIMIVPSLVVAGAAAGENVGVFGLKLTAVAGSVFCILAIFAFLRYNEREVLARSRQAARKENDRDRNERTYRQGKRDVLRAAACRDDPLQDRLQKGQLRAGGISEAPRGDRDAFPAGERKSGAHDPRRRCIPVSAPRKRHVAKRDGNVAPRRRGRDGRMAGGCLRRRHPGRRPLGTGHGRYENAAVCGAERP